MIAKKANLTGPAEIGQEDVMREIDLYLREIHFLQEQMKEDRKQIDAKRMSFEKKMKNIDQILERMEAAQG